MVFAVPISRVTWRRGAPPMAVITSWAPTSARRRHWWRPSISYSCTPSAKKCRRGLSVTAKTARIRCRLKRSAPGAAMNGWCRWTARCLGPDGFKRLQPADVAVLVRDRKEAAAIRRALARRRVASVYLSDKDSVIDSEEAADVLRWLTALANPLDGGLARAAFATRTIGLSLGELARLSNEELEWERRVEQLKSLHLIWQRQGVLAMLRRFKCKDFSCST